MRWTLAFAKPSFATAEQGTLQSCADKDTAKEGLLLRRIPPKGFKVPRALPVGLHPRIPQGKFDAPVHRAVCFQAANKFGKSGVGFRQVLESLNDSSRLFLHGVAVWQGNVNYIV